VRWLDETTKTAQKGWVGCGIAQGSRFYSPEARGNKEREGFEMDSVTVNMEREAGVRRGEEDEG
jgi:hypothetical protein